MSTKIDEIRERAKKALKESWRCQGTIQLSFSVEDIPNLCDALKHAKLRARGLWERLITIEDAPIKNAITNKEFEAKIDQILKRGKDGKD